MVKYDYGPEMNLKRYGSEEAPAIDFSTIKDVPIAVFAGKYDLFQPVEDIRKVKDQLAKNVLKYYGEYDYGHITFLIGKDMHYLDKMQKVIKEHAS